MSTYASFQGRVFLGKRDLEGLPIEVRSPGNVAELKLSLKTDVLEHYESQTGQRSLDHRMVKQKSATVNLTIEEFTKENLALALYGNHVTGSTGSVTAETIGGAAPVVGDRYFLAHPKVSALVVVDSAGTPATLTLGTHYTADTDFGALQFLDTTGFTAPFKASYAYGVATEIGIFTQALPERYLRLEGVNTAQATPRCWSSSTAWPSTRSRRSPSSPTSTTSSSWKARCWPTAPSPSTRCWASSAALCNCDRGEP